MWGDFNCIVLLGVAIPLCFVKQEETKKRYVCARESLHVCWSG